MTQGTDDNHGPFAGWIPAGTHWEGGLTDAFQHLDHEPKGGRNQGEVRGFWVYPQKRRASLGADTTPCQAQPLSTDLLSH